MRSNKARSFGVSAASASDLLLANGQERYKSVKADANELLLDAIEKYSRQQNQTLPRNVIRTHGSQSLSN